MIQYEYVYRHGRKVFARIFDNDTNKSDLYSVNIDDVVPELYIPTNEETQFVSHANNKQFLKKLEFSTVAEANNYIKDNEKYYNIHGIKNPVMQYIRYNFKDTVESMHEFHTHFIDIETRSVHGFPDVSNPIEEVTLIQIYDNFEEKYYILGTKQYTNDRTYMYGEVKYVECKDELDLLNKWVTLTQKLDPTILIGFNTYMFDFPYLINRMKKLNLAPERLSPNGEISEKPAETKDKISYIHYDIVGRILLDYRELYLKYSFAKLPKHNLETIATYELGEGKVEHSEYDSFEQFYIEDYQKFVEYGIKDVEILVALDNKLKFIDTAKYVAYLCGVNIPDVMGTYKQWFSFMYTTSINQGEVLPLSQQYAKEDDNFIGGWVLSKPGKYEWVVSFDFASLYPSVIRLLNLGVDTIIEEKDLHQDLKDLRDKYFNWYNNKKSEEICKDMNNNLYEMDHIKYLMSNKDYINSILVKHDVCASPNGYFYRKNKESVFAGLMKKVYNDRKTNKNIAAEYTKKYSESGLEEDKFKADMYDLYQNSLKILINSAYGSLSMDVNAFSHGRGFSCGVTTGGRLANRWCNYKINEGIDRLLKTEKNLDNLPYTVQADTDSGYINISNIMQKKGLSDTIDDNIELANKVATKVIQKFIDEGVADICYLLNAKDESVLDMEHEITADKFVSTGDKRYYCRYYKKSEPCHKITGLNIISKSTPPWCKDKLKPVLDIILDNDSTYLLNYVEECRKDFKKQEPKDISVIKGVSSLEYSWKGDKLVSNRPLEKGKYLSAPIGSRSAILYNEYISKHNMNYLPIKAGDKVYMSNLKIPNPVKNQDIVGYSNPKFMDESGLTRYIDYDVMFHKNFLKNILLITDPIGWSLDKYQNSTEDWC